MIGFLPQMNTVFRYKEIQNENKLNRSHYVKNQERVANNPDKPKRKKMTANHPQMKRYRQLAEMVKVVSRESQKI